MAVIIQSMSPKEIYTEHIKTLTDEIYQLNRHNRLVVVLELTAIALAIGCIVADFKNALRTGATIIIQSKPTD